MPKPRIQMKNLSIGDWVQEGECRGLTEIFFPPSSERPQATARREARARAICSRCKVFDQCKEYARANGEYGFWAGENEYDRAVEGYFPKFGVLRHSTLQYYKRMKQMNEFSLLHSESEEQ